MSKHELLGGKVHVYKRENSRYWQCSTYLSGKNWRESTKKKSLAEATDFAEDWYLGLRGKLKSGELKTGKSFRVVSEVFTKEYEVITGGDRSPKHVQRLKDCIRVHLLPYFQDTAVTEITAGSVQEYRAHRIGSSRTGKPPARNTIHQEIVALRQVLQTAHRHGWLPSIPNISPPYKTSGKVGHRAWLSPKEYRQLYMATRQRAETPPKKRWKRECEQLHDYVLFMANTGLRPDEARRLQYRDVSIVKDAATRQTILEIRSSRQTRRRLLQEHGWRSAAIHAPREAQPPAIDRPDLRKRPTRTLQRSVNGGKS